MIICIIFKSLQNVKPCRDLPGDWKFVSSRQKISSNKLYTSDVGYTGSLTYYDQALQHLGKYYTKYDKYNLIR